MAASIDNENNLTHRSTVYQFGEYPTQWHNKKMDDHDASPTFICQTSFVQSAAKWLDEETLAVLEQSITANPRVGEVIRGSNGARKVRFALPGGGKSGGARAIYVYVKVRGSVYMLLAYRKVRQENLTLEQTKAIAAAVRIVQQEEPR